MGVIKRAWKARLNGLDPCFPNGTDDLNQQWLKNPLREADMRLLVQKIPGYCLLVCTIPTSDEYVWDFEISISSTSMTQAIPVRILFPGKCKDPTTGKIILERSIACYAEKKTPFQILNNTINFVSGRYAEIQDCSVSDIF
jgi:hypothetical protein